MEAANAPANQVVGLLPFIILFIVFYLLLIRPQQQRQKQHREMIQGLRVSDQVITAGGIYGTIVKVKEDSVILRIADNVRIEIMKQAIAQIREKNETEGKHE